MATGVSLAEAICLEENKAMTHLGASIKASCFGNDGSLGKAKKSRSTAAMVTHGKDSTLDD